MHCNRGGVARRRGMGLVETAAAVGVLSVGFVISAGVVNTVKKVWASSSAQTVVESRRAAVGVRIADLFRGISAATLVSTPVAPTGASTITFKRVVSITAGGVAVLGPTTTIKWVPSTTDPENGADDDRDGVIDDGAVVMDVGPVGSIVRTVIVTGVPARFQGEVADYADNNGNGLIDERGFALETRGRRLVVRLNLARKGPDGVLVSRISDVIIPMGN